MGAPWAPAYVCLNLGLWEEEEVVYKSSMYLDHCHLWLRYIDDILMVWSGKIEQLTDFMQELNQNERNIGHTYSHQQVTLSFLDLQISIEETKIITKKFRKETAADTLLQAQSHHPRSLIHGIPTGQFLRMMRNCSKDLEYKEEASELH